VVAARSNDGKVYLLESASGKQRWSYSRTLPALTLREQSHLLLSGNACLCRPCRRQADLLWL
jgi:outer membrane protein assembly factor BamB